MPEIPQAQPDLIRELDFSKHGLSHLKEIPPAEWPEDDSDKLIAAYAAENIAPAIYGLSFTPDNVRGLLALAECVRCGRCCLPNNAVPEHPGVTVSESDLRYISEHTSHSYKSLKKKATISHNPRFITGRYLPLPCLFYDKKEHGCAVYQERPLICRTFPVTDIPGRQGLAVNVACDYGRNIYRAVLNHIAGRGEFER